MWLHGWHSQRGKELFTRVLAILNMWAHFGSGGSGSSSYCKELNHELKKFFFAKLQKYCFSNICLLTIMSN